MCDSRGAEAPLFYRVGALRRFPHPFRMWGTPVVRMGERRGAEAPLFYRIGGLRI